MLADMHGSMFHGVTVDKRRASSASEPLVPSRQLPDRAKHDARSMRTSQ